MKRWFLLLSTTCLFMTLYPQVAEKMSFQAVIRNSSNQLLTNKEIGMRISIIQGSSSGTIVYQEIYDPNPETNANGLVSVEIGSGIPVIGTFSDIDWSVGPYFLMTETDPAGGSNYTITGTSQLLSVPYALYAKKAENSFSGDYNDLINIPEFSTVAKSGNYEDLIGLPNLFDGNWSSISDKPTTIKGYGITDAVNTTDDQIISGTKTFTKSIDVSNNSIINLAKPVNARDATNKEYVDSLRQQVEILRSYVKTQLNIPIYGLIAYYPFNGNANDESGNGHHGTVKMAVLNKDRFDSNNKAYMFEAQNKSHVTINYPIGNFGLSDFTISVWVKRNSVSGYEIFTQRSTPYKTSGWWELGWGKFTLNENTAYEATIDINAGDTLRNNVWYHFVGVRETNNIRFYVNGILTGSKSTQQILNITNNSNSEIGCHFFESPLQCFDGVIDDIRVYDRALSEFEIQLLYTEQGYPDCLTSKPDYNNSYNMIDWDGKVMTVHGLIPADSMGITLPHEHLLIVHKFNYLDLTNEAYAISELSYFANAGGKTLTEVTNIGIARNPEGLKRISTATGINVIMGSGFYKDKWIHDSIKSKTVEQLTDIIVNDILHGINGIHSGVIGEIGLSRPITPFEEKVLVAAARAQIATGAAVNLHFDILGEAQERHYALDILDSAGADLSRVYISHNTPYVDQVNDFISFAQRGSFVAFDLFGLEKRLGYKKPPEPVETIKALIDAGYINYLLISQDLCFSTCYVINGGFGYAHILNNIVPQLKAGGITDEQIHTIMVDNPKRILPFQISR